jgi:hypothetical protein
MAVLYHNILAQIAIRANALVGAQAAALETNYTTRPLTSANFKSSIFPFTAVKDALQTAEERFAMAIANVRKHTWRSSLLGVTATLAHKADIPAVDGAGKKIIGVWGGVYDYTDATECTEASVAQITRWVRMISAGTLKTPYYRFNKDGDRVLHTRANVVAKVCVYDRATQRTAIDANTAMLLPDVCEAGLYALGVAQLVRDDEFMNQSARFADFAKDCLNVIGQGGDQMPQLVEG